jgi:hypothetical protein
LKPTEPALADDALLETLQWETFEYFLREVNPQNGLVKDKTREGWPASIAATGLALAAYPVGVERGFMTRADAVAITLTTLTFLWDSEQSTAADATGYKGFLLPLPGDGHRQSAHGSASCRRSIRRFSWPARSPRRCISIATRRRSSVSARLPRDLYRRADWQWAQNGGATVTLGYKPKQGFLPYRWDGV